MVVDRLEARALGAGVRGVSSRGSSAVGVVLRERRVHALDKKGLRPYFKNPNGEVPFSKSPNSDDL